MKRFPLLALAALLCTTAYSAPFRISQFAGLNSGNLGSDAATGQREQWFLVGNPGALTLVTGSGSLDGRPLGLVESAGDRVFVGLNNQLNTSRNQFAANGSFPQGAETNLYFSFLCKFNDPADVGDADPSGETVIRINRANSGTGAAQHWDLIARNSAGSIQLGIAKAGAPNNVTNWAATNIAGGETIFVVVRQHILPGVQNDVYDLWINPPPASFGAAEAETPPPSASVGALESDGAEDQSGTGPGRLVLASGFNAEFDEFRFAGTWADATPPAGQCSSAAIELQPADVTQAAEISATFTVGALGTSPAIQWQRSASATAPWEDIAGATSATHSTPPLALAESGSRYRAIVAVACNNSFATSSVATVTLSAPVETPPGLVVHDTFTDPDLGYDDRANYPFSISNSVWHTASTDALAAFEQGGNLVGTPAAGSSSLWLGYFTDTNVPPIHLAPGRALKVTLPFIPNSFSSFASNARLRIGLFDYADGGVRIVADGAAAGGSRGNGRGVRGYLLNLDFGPNFSVASPLQLLARSFLGDDNLMGSIGSYTSLGSGPAEGGLQGAEAFVAGTEYTLELTVARTGENAVDLTATISGGGNTWSHTVTDTTFVYRRFDSIALRPNSLETSADSFTFPEFKVEVIDVDISAGPFDITAAFRQGSDLVLNWEAKPGAAYHVLSSPALSPANWTTNATLITSGTLGTYLERMNESRKFYRIQIAP